MTTTRVSQYIKASRQQIYRALLNPDAIAKWRVPDGMRARVQEFNPREGGAIRVSLTYDDPSMTGKTTAHTDTYRGRFAKLIPDQQIVEVNEFETADPSLRGEMTITISLTDASGGTNLVAEHEGLPPGVSELDNETGWKMALTKLARLVEDGEQPG
jgi:uncharacterized protein YndB with AHSA1/START domain